MSHSVYTTPGERVLGDGLQALVTMRLWRLEAVLTQALCYNGDLWQEYREALINEILVTIESRNTTPKE